MHASSQRLVTLLASAKPASLASLYQRHSVSPAAGVHALVCEVERDGGSTIVNTVRGHGVSYAEVVADVANFFNVDAKRYRNEVELENAILDAAWNTYCKNASVEELREIDETLNRSRSRANRNAATRVSAKVASQVALSVLLKVYGRDIFLFVLRRVILPRLGIMFAARAGLAAARGGLGAVIPGINILFAAWTVYDIDGPAMRKTVETVLEIAALRNELNEEFAIAA